MSERLEEALEGIDQCLANLHVIYLSDDLRAAIEADVWAELSEAVEQGWYELEHAQSMFMEWRSEFLGLQD